jgi:hypothetical protein
MKPQGTVLVIACLATACGVAAATCYFCSQRPRFTQEQAKKLQRGMTVAEVTEVLGGPPGDYTDGRRSYATGDVAFIKSSHKIHWCGNEGAIGLLMEGDGTLQFAVYYPAVDLTPNWMKRIKVSLSFVKG